MHYLFKILYPADYDTKNFILGGGGGGRGGGGGQSPI